MKLRNLLFLSILFINLGAKAETEDAVKFLSEIEGNHSLTGEKECADLRLNFNQDRTSLILGVGPNNLSFDLTGKNNSTVSNTKVKLKNDKLVITKESYFDDTYDSWFTGTKRITVVIEKEGSQLKSLTGVDKYKKFFSPIFITRNKINCKQ